jgi:spore germination protein YaaH
MLAMALVVVACGTSDETPNASLATTAAPSASVGPSATVVLGGSGEPSVAPSAVPSASPSATPPVALVPGTADPAKFGFRAKGLSHEVMAFVTTAQLDYGVETLDLDVVSTIAFFSLEATGTGHLKHDKRWTRWNSATTDRLIARAHAGGTKVVLSLARFAWSPGQTKLAREVLSQTGRRQLLATEVAAEVARRGIDGVNVDFEPIPIGQKANFTDFVHRMRAALDAIRPGYQLTFDVSGHHDSYDVAGALRPGGADAVYLMGYHYAGTWSTIAGSTSPLSGPRYDVSDTIKSLLRFARPDQLIVGLPYYGHVWPTKTNRVHSRTAGRGHDVQYFRATAVAARLGSRWDPVEQVRWVVFRDRACGTCPVTWFQLYFDDARSLGAKYKLIKRRGLLGTGVWTSAFEGGSRELTAALREAFVAPAH